MKSCAACKHSIDETARICPYCGADPATGEKADTQALLQEVFNPKQLTASESVIEYARQRQGIVVTIVVILSFLILAALHQFVTARNNAAVASGPAVSLSEIADLSDQNDNTKPAPMPDITYQFDGRAQTMRTFISEPGAVMPPEVVAAQQQARQAAAAQQQARQPATAPAPPAPH